MDAPSGTVTLLFTDIEGSTALWENKPQEMRIALARHDELMTSSITESKGYIFKALGDAFCAAFTNATDGVRAAQAVQIAIANDEFEGSLKLKIRVGLHTGACEERGGDYFGPTVNRTARLMATSHGGQVVISKTTADLVRDDLPPGSWLRDLGEHRLKDLGRPEQIFQLDIPGLQSEFGPLMSLDNPAFPNNLPAQVNAFIGRETEVTETKALVQESPLVTLTGTGGCGKTRLALQVAAELLDSSSDGVWLVELAGVSDPELVQITTAGVLGVREEAGRPILDTLLEALRERRMLIVLDNCEHLLNPCAQMINALLRSCPNVHVLATSREPIGIDAEQLFKVPSLSLPTEGDGSVTVAEAQASEAVQLFIDRATRHQPSFVFDDMNCPSVVSICRRLDGIPLGIELAAARLRSLSAADIEQRLGDRFRLLNSGGRGSLARHQTLRALVDWSYELLNQSEALVLSRLSVFAGGFTIEAAEAVCVGDAIEGFHVLSVLGSLTDKSLVQMDQKGASIRYHLLETIRQYAEERLAERGETARHAARDAHASVYLELVEAGAPHLIGGDQRLWFDRLDVERDNLRSAMAYLLGAAGRHEQALRFGIALRWFWYARGYWAEGSDLLGAALEMPGSHAPRELRAAALCAAGHLCSRRADYITGQRHFDEGLKIARVLGDEGLIADNLSGIAWIAYKIGRRLSAVPIMDEALEFARLSGIPQLIGRILERRASVSYDDPEISRSDFAEALEYLRVAQDRFGIGIVENNLADLELLMGNPEVARVHLENAIAISHEIQDESVVYCYLNLGNVGIVLGDFETARGSYFDALHGARKIGDQAIIAMSILGLALCQSAGGDDEPASVLHGAADNLLAQVGEVLEAMETRLRAEDQLRLKERLGDERFTQCYNTGKALSVNDSIARAMKATGVAS